MRRAWGLYIQILYKDDFHKVLKLHDSQNSCIDLYEKPLS